MILSDKPLTDTHCHLNLEAFDLDREVVVERATRAGVGRILVPGTNLESSRTAQRLAESSSLLFAAVGIHPTEATPLSDPLRDELHHLANHARVKAVGEIGLDYYWDTTPHDMQRDLLKEQLGMAGNLHLPVVIHFREKESVSEGECALDLMEVLHHWVAKLRAEKSPLVDRVGVLHAFSGSQEMATQAMRLGFYLGVGGPVTYKNNRVRQELVAALPLDRILLETDAPYQTPHPHRGERNEPAYVGLIADKIGVVHSISNQQVIESTRANAQRLFTWE